MRPGKVLVLIPLSAECVTALQDTHDTLVSPKGWPEVDVARDGAAMRAVVTNGSRGLSAVEMAALPALELIACYGAGHENVDLAAARQRGIAVTSAPGANSDTVADHALGLMLAVARDIPARDRAVRAGGWDAIRGARPTLTGATLGLLGLGQIGARIARRAAAFDMRVVYHTPKAKPDVPWAYAATPAALEAALERALRAYAQPEAWRKLMKTAMAQDFSWDGAAAGYLALYQRLAGGRE